MTSGRINQVTTDRPPTTEVTPQPPSGNWPSLAWQSRGAPGPQRAPKAPGNCLTVSHPFPSEISPRDPRKRSHIDHTNTPKHTEARTFDHPPGKGWGSERRRTDRDELGRLAQGDLSSPQSPQATGNNPTGLPPTTTDHPGNLRGSETSTSETSACAGTGEGTLSQGVALTLLHKRPNRPLRQSFHSIHLHSTPYPLS